MSLFYSQTHNVTNHVNNTFWSNVDANIDREPKTLSLQPTILYHVTITSLHLLSIKWIQNVGMPQQPTIDNYVSTWSQPLSTQSINEALLGHLPFFKPILFRHVNTTPLRGIVKEWPWPLIWEQLHIVWSTTTTTIGFETKYGLQPITNNYINTCVRPPSTQSINEAPLGHLLFLKPILFRHLNTMPLRGIVKE